MGPSLEQQIYKIIAEEGNVEVDNLKPEAELDKIGMDSVDMVCVIFALEDAYDVEIETDEVFQFKTLGELVTNLITHIESKK